MARPRSIDREWLLDLAEDCVSQGGVAALSFGSLAKAAELSKASVQSVFGTRDRLLEALLGRWVAREESIFTAQLEDDPTPQRRVKIHLSHTEQESLSVGKTVCTMLATLSGNEEVSTAMQDWYTTRMDGLIAQDQASRNYRVAYLAAEGAFLLRHLVGLEISEALWEDIFGDLQNIADGTEDSSSRA